MISAKGVSTVDGLINSGYRALRGVTKKGEKVYRRVVESPSKFGDDTAVKSDYVLMRGKKVVKKYSRHATGRDDNGTTFESLDLTTGNQRGLFFFHHNDGRFRISVDEYTGALDYVDEKLVKVPATHQLVRKSIIVSPERKVIFALSSIERGKGGDTVYDLDFLYPAYKRLKERFVGKYYEEVEMPNFTSLAQTLTDKNIFV